MGELGHADTIVLQPDFQAILKAKDDRGFGPTMRTIEQALENPILEAKEPELYREIMRTDLTSLAEAASGAIDNTPLSSKTEDDLLDGIEVGDAPATLTMKKITNELPDEGLIRSCAGYLYFSENPNDIYQKIMGDLLSMKSYDLTDQTTPAGIRIALLHTYIQTYLPGLFGTNISNGHTMNVEQVASPSAQEFAQLPSYDSIWKHSQEIAISDSPIKKLEEEIKKIQDSPQIPLEK